MQAENAAGLGDSFGVLVGAMARGDNFFGGLLFEVGAPVRDDSIAGIRRVAIAPISHDGMNRDIRTAG